MKYLNLTIIALGLCLLGCNQTNSKNKLTTEVNSVDTTSIQTQEQEDESNLYVKKSYIKTIKRIRIIFKEQNFDSIASIMHFPFYGSYPIKPIENKEEFRLRFNEVFDTIIMAKIANSKLNEWGMDRYYETRIDFDNGMIWTGTDLKISDVNYNNDFENKVLEDAIAKDKAQLHSSLKTFESPYFKFKTKDYLIRIDILADHTYRYASWKLGKKESSKPLLIINHGTGQAYSYRDEFNFPYQNDTIYWVSFHRFQYPESTDFSLFIEKDGKSILSQDGTPVI